MNPIVTYRGPVGVRAVELTKPLEALENLSSYDHVRVFFLWNDAPMAMADIPNHGRTVSAARLRDVAVEFCYYQIVQKALVAHLSADAAASAPDDVALSVVVATLDRPDLLQRCLESLRAQATVRPLEIVVVDNNPASGVTPPVVAGFPGVVLVNETRRGLSYARNAGITTSRGEIIACADDDVVIPRGWADAIVAPFADPTVMAVTGNVLPLELETRAQRLYEAYGGLGRGFHRRTVDGAWFRSFRAAVPTWTLGATANAAFRAQIFSDPTIGLMEESLGAGMPAGVGEDTYLFYRILKAGHRMVYEPSAYLWHQHRSTIPELHRQLAAYSRGHVAYHLTTLVRDGDWRALWRLAALARWDLRQMLRWAWHSVRSRRTYPLSLVLLETWGHVMGPWAYWESRRRVRRQGTGHRAQGTGPSELTE